MSWATALSQSSASRPGFGAPFPAFCSSRSTSSFVGRNQAHFPDIGVFPRRVRKEIYHSEKDQQAMPALYVLPSFSIECPKRGLVARGFDPHAQRPIAIDRPAYNLCARLLVRRKPGALSPYSPDSLGTSSVVASDFTRKSAALSRKWQFHYRGSARRFVA
jgi:hypothetical protein